jgi:hypothetical protein
VNLILTHTLHIESSGVCVFLRIPKVGCDVESISGEESVVQFTSQYLETYFRIIIVMKRGMSFNFYNFINSLIRVLPHTLLLDFTFRTETTSMYEDTIYIALPIPNGKYNILQLFL